MKPPFPQTWLSRATCLALLCFAVPAARAQLNPLAFSQPAAPIRATSATLNGMVWVKGYEGLAWFEWGPDSQYGNVTDPLDTGTNTTVVRLSTALTNLTEGGVYHFRLVVSNAMGVARGIDQRFTTGMRVQNWGSYPYYAIPAVPPGLTNLVSVAAGHAHCLAIRNDGSVVAWNAGGYLYPNHGQTNVPAGLSNVVAVAGGFSHSLALNDDGTVVAWGGYADGTPVQVPPGLTNVIAIGGGDYHCAALKADGTVVSWGKTGYWPTNATSNLRNVVAISSGSSYILALGANSTVSMCGSSGSSILSLGQNLVGISTESSYNLALASNSTVTANGAVSSDVPMPAHLSNVVALAAGYLYAEVLKTDGTLTAWGRAADATNLPPLLSNVVALASGDYHSVALAPSNLPPVAFTTQGYGPTNHDLTVTLRGFDPNGDPLTGIIISLPANGRLFQFTPTGRGDEITSPGTLLTDPTHVIFEPAPGGFGVAYGSFSFALSDGLLQSAPANCTIAIVPPPVIQSATMLHGSTNGFSVIFSGLAGGTYSVLFSKDLRFWFNAGLATEIQPGLFSLLDTSATNKPVGFYRPNWF